jgi:hypothetical protein
MLNTYKYDSPLDGHLGVFKTLSKIREHFIWRAIDKEVRDKVRQCHTCSLSKPAQNTRFGLLSSDVAQRPLQKLFIDFVGKFPRSKPGNTGILVCVDAFSKFIWMIPVREGTTRATVKAHVTMLSSMYVSGRLYGQDKSKVIEYLDFVRSPALKIEIKTRNFGYRIGLRPQNKKGSCLSY